MAIALPGYVLCLAAIMDIGKGVGVAVGVAVEDGVMLGVGELVDREEGDGVAGGRRVLVEEDTLTLVVATINCGRSVADCPHATNTNTRKIPKDASKIK